MYTVNKLDTGTPVHVKNVICTLYGYDAVGDAKWVFWERNLSCRSNIKLGEDVIEAVRFISAFYQDKDILPVVFVGLRMSNIPPACEQIMPLGDDQLQCCVSTIRCCKTQKCDIQKKDSGKHE